MPSDTRPWHKRLRKSLEYTRRRSSKQDATNGVQIDAKITPSCEARDDELMDSRNDETNNASNETKEKNLRQLSDATYQNKTSATSSASRVMTSDIIVEGNAEKDGADNVKPTKSNLTNVKPSKRKLRAKPEQVNLQVRENECENSKKGNEREGREDKESSQANQVKEDDDIISFPEENATCLADNNDMICIESSMSNLSFNTIRTEYNLPPEVGKDEETESQLSSSTNGDQSSTTWTRLKACFGLLDGKESEDTINDDALSHFVIHNVKKDLGEVKSHRGVLNRNRKEVDSAALLNKINDVKKTIHALEMKRSNRTTASRGKETEEDSRIAMLNSKVEAMVLTLETQVKEIISESEQLGSEMENTAEDEIDSVAMEMALDGYEDLQGTDTEESEDTFHRLLSRVFNCKIGKRGSASFSPNCSLISDDSESVMNEEVPFHTRRRFEI